MKESEEDRGGYKGGQLSNEKSGEKVESTKLCLLSVGV